MTLTPEQVAQYEARAAKGEKPRLEWADWPGIGCSEVPGTAGFLRIAWEGDKADRSPFTARMGAPGTSDVFRKGTFSTLTAAKLFLDDALLAFAAPLLDAPVEGPFRVQHVGDWWIVVDSTLKESPTVCPDSIEAQAIARERNRAWQRRQRETKT